MPRPKRKVLLLTDSDPAQSSVFLATSHALLQLGAEVHLASFSSLSEAVRTTSADLTFHALPTVDASLANHKNDELVSPFRVRGIVSYLFSEPLLLRLSSLAAIPWTGPDCIAIYRAVVRLLCSLQPDVVAVGPTFAPAVTACRHTGQRFVILAPNSIGDFALPFQPGGEMFWKYPSPTSDIPFPVPWHLILLNIVHALFALLFVHADPDRRNLQQSVGDHIGTPLTTIQDLIYAPPADVRYLISSRHEIELPLRIIPPHIVPCGPILRVALPLSETNPDLSRWLSCGPTVYIDLEPDDVAHEGASNAEPAKPTGARTIAAAEVARCVSALLSKARSRKGEFVARLQVFWPSAPADGGVANQLFASAGGQDDTNIRTGTSTGALVPDSLPDRVSVLEHGNVICVVSDGSSSSFLSAVAAGVPQVVLTTPASESEAGCFDAARRAEALGVGRWGNRASHPGCRLAELGAALEEVVLGGRAGEMRHRAAELAGVCGREPGRMVAARAILAEM